MEQTLPLGGGHQVITYNAEGIEKPALCEEQVSQWLERVAALHGRKVGDINYIFVDDERILEINREFIGHDYYTDHIGFDYSEGSFLSGDIYISLDTVRTNADKWEQEYQEELRRVIVHGLLHLCGIKDKTSEERAVMENEENKALAQYDQG